MNNNVNNCCCSCGLKKAICLINNLGDLVDSTDKLTVYFDGELTIKKATLKESKYPNLYLTIGNFDNTSTSINMNVCLESLNAICIKPTSGNYMSIINILNREYNCILSLQIPCNENCCCKYSFLSFFRDKYIEPDPSKRLFNIGICGIPITDNIIKNKLTFIHCDYDVVWLLDPTLALIYLVPLCKIYGVTI